jgi:amidase
LADFAALNARSKFWGDDGRAAFRNWEEVADPRNALGGRQGVDERIMLRELLRRVDMMVMLENRLDALVRLHTPLPPAKIGGAHDPLGGRNNLRLESFYGPNAGLTEVLIPAGYVTTVYDPVFALSSDRTRSFRSPATPPRPCHCPACRSRSSFARSPAEKTSCCGSPRPTKPHRSAASHHPPSALCWRNCVEGHSDRIYA